MPVFGIEKLENICKEIFKGAGLSDAEAHRVSHSLVVANMMQTNLQFSSSFWILITLVSV